MRRRTCLGGLASGLLPALSIAQSNIGAVPTVPVPYDSQSTGRQPVTPEDFAIRSERQMLRGVEQLLDYIPKLNAAFAAVAAPLEKAQYRRGLERLSGAIRELLTEKRLVISGAGALRGPDAYREARQKLESAIRFLDPEKFDSVFKAPSGKDLRALYLEAERSIRFALSGKETAEMMRMFPSVSSNMQLRDLLTRTEKALVDAERVVNNALVNS